MIKIYFTSFLRNYLRLIFFLPYYFSVIKLLKTLFTPWKNLTEKPKRPGFHPGEILSAAAFNLISSCIGLWVRLSTLLAYVFLQILVILLFPVFFALHILFLPIYLIREAFYPRSKKIKDLRKRFISQRALRKENIKKVEKWFEIFFKKQHHLHNHSLIEKIFQAQPIGLDWDTGYTPNLDKFCLDMTSAQYQQNLTEIVDRDKELKDLQEKLTKIRGANVILRGPTGVGKHTIIDALSKLIYTHKSHSLLTGSRLLKMNLDLVLSSSKDKIQRRNLLDQLLSEAEKAGNIILFIDNLAYHLLDKNLNLISILQKYLNSSRLHIITICNEYQYASLQNAYPQLEKIFSVIPVKEISDSQTLQILLEKIFYYEQKYKIIFAYETLKKIISYSNLYPADLHNPEKAFKMIEEYIAYLSSIGARKATPENLEEFISKRTDIPIKITKNIKKTLSQLDQLLQRQILYQKQAVEDIATAIKRAFLNFENRKRPLASFLLLGPTGVGKTHTAKTLAHIFFGSVKDMLRLDMQSIPSASYLLGEPAVGIPSELQIITEKHKFGVLLLDEFEKAPPDVQQVFLSILDEGYVKTAYGKTLDFRFYFILATSNAASEIIAQLKTKSEIIDYLIKKKIFAPELINRFDDIIIYQPLPLEVLITIAKEKTKKILKYYQDKYKLNQIDLRINWEKLIKESEYKRFGAREVDRIIRKKIEPYLIDSIIGNLDTINQNRV